MLLILDVFLILARDNHENGQRWPVMGDLGEVTDLAVQKPDTSLALFAGISN